MDCRTVDREDRERKCTMERRVRLRIGSKYPDLLPNRGLTAQEAAGAIRWAKLSASERQAIADRGKAILAANRNPNSETNQL